MTEAAELMQLPDIPAGYMRDAKGRLVPESMITAAAKLEDQTVYKIIGYAQELSAQIARFKGHSFDDVGSFMALLDEQYGVKRGGVKGNVTLSSYDGCAKIQVSVQDRLSFGPELQTAKALIDEVIAAWTIGSRPEIKTLVDHAFAVDKQGQINAQALFNLRRLQIDDDAWRRAMDALTDSIRVIGSAVYMRFYKRPHPEQKWSAVTIDLASATLPAPNPAPDMLAAADVAAPLLDWVAGQGTDQTACEEEANNHA